MGTQKAGTTWMYRYFCQHTSMRPGEVKEYHVLHRGFSTSFKKNNALKRAIYRRKAEGTNRYARRLWGMRLGRRMSDYIDYFDALLSRPEDDNHTVFTADMTPGNITLWPEKLQQLSDQMAGRGIIVKPVMMLRDPVERLHSAARMFVRRSGKTGRDAELAQLQFNFNSGDNFGHGRYDVALANLSIAFPEGAAHVGLYEELFRPGAPEAIMSWIGVPPEPPPLDTRVNASVRTYDLDEALQREIALRYAPSYHAAAARFGTERIAQLWPSARFIL
ncbi:hypothetical protein [Oceanicola sp. S124]|uniref:hypothetical protein n=1 Tax=Oceanicola sp. S124 TaxID=1042378 RepID=UPI00110FB149|nr:hypothetical protein [Oceanicola sp. S124]